MSFIRDWVESRRQTREIERDLEARRGKARIKRHIQQQQKATKKLWGLGKRALQLGEQRQFRQIAMHLLWTQEDIKRWERYLLSFETIEARRDQARAMNEFMRSIHAMSRSMLANTSPQSIAQTQRDLELGIARAQSLEETLSYMMDVTDETIFGLEDIMDDDSLEARLRELETGMGQEAEVDEGTTLDSKIEEGLRRIEEQMRKDLK